jgi:membrane fusion protein, multidrug efflux system
MPVARLLRRAVPNESFTREKDEMNRMWMLPAVAAGLLLAGCGDKKAEEKKEEAAVPVEVARVAVGPIDAAYRGTATLEAQDEATVNARSGGVIEQVLVEEGDHVRAGQVLARLETAKLRLELERARATRDNVEEVFKRNASVFQRNLVSREAYDKSKSELEVARAAYDLGQLALRDAEIRAPFDGVISLRHIKVGNQLQPGAPTFRVTRMDQLQASIFVPERDIQKLARGQSTTLTVDAWPGKAFKGEILRVNPVVDATTGTVKVTVAMAPQQPELKPGMFGRIEILYDRKPNAVLVAKDAVITEDAATSVFVVASGKARRRNVKLGYSDAEHFEVLEGLVAGDQVVTTGQANLKDDARIEVVNSGASVPAEKAQDVAEGSRAGTAATH